MTSIEKEAMKIYDNLGNITGDASNKGLMKDVEDFIHTMDAFREEVLSL